MGSALLQAEPAMKKVALLGNKRLSAVSNALKGCSGYSTAFLRL